MNIVKKRLLAIMLVLSLVLSLVATKTTLVIAAEENKITLGAQTLVPGSEQWLTINTTVKGEMKTFSVTTSAKLKLTVVSGAGFAFKNAVINATTGDTNPVANKEYLSVQLSATSAEAAQNALNSIQYYCGTGTSAEISVTGDTVTLQSGDYYLNGHYYTLSSSGTMSWKSSMEWAFNLMSTNPTRYPGYKSYPVVVNSKEENEMLVNIWYNNGSTRRQIFLPAVPVSPAGGSISVSGTEGNRTVTVTDEPYASTVTKTALGHGEAWKWMDGTPNAGEPLPNETGKVTKSANGYYWAAENPTDGGMVYFGHPTLGAVWDDLAVGGQWGSNVWSNTITSGTFYGHMYALAEWEPVSGAATNASAASKTLVTPDAASIKGVRANGRTEGTGDSAVTYYTSLQTAINNAQAGDEVEMLRDIAGNVTVADTKNIALDLNGYVLQGTGSGSVITNNGTLTVKDSGSTSTHFYKVGSNGVWALDRNSKTGIAYEDLTARPATNAIIAVKGGAITGGSTDIGGGIRSFGNLTVEGGNIIGNYASSVDLYNAAGAGIFFIGNSLKMTGGRVIGNAARLGSDRDSMNGGGGGGLALAKGTFDFSGGEISFNAARYASGIRIGGNTNAVTAIMNMSGTAAIQYNLGNGCGTAIQMHGYDATKTVVNMTGGTISGNCVTNPGTNGAYDNGVLVYIGTFNMTGGVIKENNTSYVTGGAVRIWNGSFATFGGTAKIDGNTDKNGAHNLHLDKGALAVVSTTKTLQDTAKIGVTSGSTLELIPVTDFAATDYSKYFSSDNASYTVQNVTTGNNDKRVVLVKSGYTVIDSVSLDCKDYENYRIPYYIPASNTDYSWEITLSNLAKNPNSCGSFLGINNGNRSGYLYSPNDGSDQYFQVAVGSSYKGTKYYLFGQGKNTIHADYTSTGSGGTYSLYDTLGKVASKAAPDTGTWTGSYAYGSSQTFGITSCATYDKITAASEFLSMKLYDLRIWDNASGKKTLKYDGVMVTKNDGLKVQSGIYDMVSGTFTGTTVYSNLFTVTLDNQSATTAGTASVKAVNGLAMADIKAPAKTGFIFNGYYSAVNGGGTKYYNADGTSAKNYDLNSDTTLYAYWKPVVAAVYDGERLVSEFASVQEAVNASSNGNTVKMLQNSVENVTIPAEKAITLDLNGKVLSAASGTVLTNKGSLSIVDNSTGAIHYFTVNNNGLWVYDDSNTLNAVNASAFSGRPDPDTVIAVNGGCITGGNAASNGGGIYNDGKLKLDSINLIGNTAAQDGSALYIADGKSADLNNVSVLGNIAGNRGAVYCKDTQNPHTGVIKLANCLIANNYAATAGGGAAFSGCTVIVGGSTIFSNNLSGATFAKDNLIIGKDTKIELGTKQGKEEGNGVPVPTVSGLTKARVIPMSIGVGLWDGTLPTVDHPVEITVSASIDYSGCFLSDNVLYKVYNVGSGSDQKVYLSLHDHVWHYELDEEDSTTLKAWCTEEFNQEEHCLEHFSEENADTLTILPPSALIYDGNDKLATIKDDKTTLGGLTFAPVITYEYKAHENDEYGTADDLKKAGYYKATVKLGTDPDALTASVEYRIAPAKGLTVTCEDYEGVFNGELHRGEAAVLSMKEGVLVLYSIDEGRSWSTEIPAVRNSGTYHVLVLASKANFVTAFGEYTMTIAIRPAEEKEKNVTSLSLPEVKEEEQPDNLAVAKKMARIKYVSVYEDSAPPVTGDQFPFLQLTATMLLSALGICLLVFRKKPEEEAGNQ